MSSNTNNGSRGLLLLSEECPSARSLHRPHHPASNLFGLSGFRNDNSPPAGRNKHNRRERRRASAEGSACQRISELSTPIEAPVIHAMWKRWAEGCVADGDWWGRHCAEGMLAAVGLIHICVDNGVRGKLAGWVTGTMALPMTGRDPSASQARRRDDRLPVVVRRLPSLPAR